jgi:hypothetical protein
MHTGACSTRIQRSQLAPLWPVLATVGHSPAHPALRYMAVPRSRDPPCMAVPRGRNPGTPCLPPPVALPPPAAQHNMAQRAEAVQQLQAAQYQQAEAAAMVRLRRAASRYAAAGGSQAGWH